MVKRFPSRLSAPVRACTLLTCLAALPAAAQGAKASPQAAPAAQSDAVVQKVGHGEINWSKKVVTATGSGAAKLSGSVAAARLGAERAAKLDALRNILETIQGIQVSGSRSANDLMSNGEVKTRISGLAQGFSVQDTKYYSDGSVDVVVSMPIDEQLTRALVDRPAGARKLSTTGAASFSGLIVNARGLGLVPSMAPRVLDEAGREVYGLEVVTDAGLKQGGIAGYAKHEQDVADRVGDKPLIVKAMRLADKTKTDLVIANAEADRLRDAKSNLSFLADGKVVILVD